MRNFCNFLRYFETSFQKKRKKSCFLKCEKNTKYVFSNTAWQQVDNQSVNQSFNNARGSVVMQYNIPRYRREDRVNIRIYLIVL